jgi:hypothetical protein
VTQRFKKVPEVLNDDVNFDVLGDILETLRFRGSIFFSSELAAPWGLSLEMVGIPRFHIALLGECFVGGDSGEAIKVQHGEIMMLPSGNPHWIADQPGRKLVPSARAGEACELGDPLFQEGEITNRLICGLVHFDQEVTHPILDALPEMMHFPMLEPSGPIWATVAMIDSEMQHGCDRVGPIVDRLTEVLFLQLINHYAERNRGTTGFLAALRDRRVQRALTLIHRQPDFDWSLAALSEKIGMSRATLVRHFQDAVGMAPMAYIRPRHSAICGATQPTAMARTSRYEPTMQKLATRSWTSGLGGSPPTFPRRGYKPVRRAAPISSAQSSASPR